MAPFVGSGRQTVLRGRTGEKEDTDCGFYEPSTSSFIDWLATLTETPVLSRSCVRRFVVPIILV
jgi:hypothetical protein